MMGREEPKWFSVTVVLKLLALFGLGENLVVGVPLVQVLASGGDREKTVVSMWLWWIRLQPLSMLVIVALL